MHRSAEGVYRVERFGAARFGCERDRPAGEISGDAALLETDNARGRGDCLLDLGGSAGVGDDIGRGALSGREALCKQLLPLNRFRLGAERVAGAQRCIGLEHAQGQHAEEERRRNPDTAWIQADPATDPAPEVLFGVTIDIRAKLWSERPEHPATDYGQNRDQEGEHAEAG